MPIEEGGKGWLDVCIRIRGPCDRDFEQIFEQRWIHRDDENPRAVRSIVAHHADVLVISDLAGGAAQILDAHLAGNRYMTGDRFTVADIVVGCAAHRWLNLPVDRVARPNLERWYAEISARPASRQVTTQKPLT